MAVPRLVHGRRLRGPRPLPAWAERPFYRLLGTSPESEQSWKRYAGSLVIFSGAFVAFGYLLLRIQGSLPLNPQHLGAVTPALSFNTAVSFLTNTNWQNYAGETTMSYFSQIGVLTVQQFVSAAVGIAVAIAMVRGFSRRNSADHRQLLGRCHPLHDLHPAADFLRGRHRGRRPGRRADVGRAGKHP